MAIASQNRSRSSNPESALRAGAEPGFPVRGQRRFRHCRAQVTGDVCQVNPVLIGVLDDLDVA
jgi:hypothetical protein